MKTSIVAVAALFLANVISAQAVTEFPIPTAGANPLEIAAGPDGNLWFTENGANKIGRITLAGVVTEYPVPTAASSPQGICAGPDGAMWFTEHLGGNIGRITTAGVITEFPLPAFRAPYQLPNDIALGPEGALWITAGGGPFGYRITRMTTSGAVTDFELYGGLEHPLGIATGPDGNLWFVEDNVYANNVGRLTVDGTLTEFPVPSDPALPHGIATGADGNLWVTEELTGKIARVTPAGVFTEFPIPTSGSAPHGVALGPDGNVWFTESGANQVGRSTASGVVTEFAIPTASSGLEGIAAGPDGAVWFVETTGNKIGRIDVGSQALTVASISPTSGPAAGGTVVAITGSGFAADATVAVGLRPAGGVSAADPAHASATTPQLLPGTLNDVVVTNPADGGFGVLPKRWFSDFLDVPGSHVFHPFVETLVRNGVTAGCGNGAFCASSSVTRAQAVVFLLRSTEGAAYVPPNCTTPTFSDVACSSAFARWVDEAAIRGITAGCGGGAFCPNDVFTRAQIAVFLLRAHDGASYAPPPATGTVFLDVPAGSFAAAWIEELAHRGITGGCGDGNYCPVNPVTRGQAAVFLVTTFGLTF